MNTLSAATATATGDGRNASDAGLLVVDGRVPQSMDGPGGATKPEQRSAACIHSAMEFVAAADKIFVTGTEVSAGVSVGMLPAAGFGLAVELDVHAPSLAHAVALVPVERVHRVCSSANATRGDIEAELSVV